MLVLGLILSVFAIGFLCRLGFALAVHALPLFIAVTVGLFAYHHDAGPMGALLVALIAGTLTLALGRMAFALMPSAFLRALIVLSFAVPAAVAGYTATFGLIQLSVASYPRCRAFGAVGALLTGGTAFARITAPCPPGWAGFAHPSAVAPVAGGSNA
jgi:hypothetical protein